jgi:hypothetical protein
MTSDLDIPAPGADRPIPEEGLAHAVCVFVEPMGECLDDYPGKPPRIVKKARFFFELQQVIPDGHGDMSGKPFMLSTSGIVLSAHEKSNLSKTLHSWLGKECPANINGFQLKTLVGRHATLNVVHKEKRDGGVTARIDKVLPAQKSAPKLAPVATAPPPWVDKERAENAAKVAAYRKGESARQSGHQPPDDEPQTFDEVPF